MASTIELIFAHHCGVTEIVVLNGRWIEKVFGIFLEVGFSFKEFWHFNKELWDHG